MEETKELQTMYKIFRCLIYLSLIVEFFEYAIDPALLDYWGGIVCDIHSRVKRWFIYMDGNLVWSKIATIVLICITCIGTRNKKHLEFDARRQVFYPLVSGLFVTILSIWLCGTCPCSNSASGCLRYTCSSVAPGIAQKTRSRS